MYGDGRGIEREYRRWRKASRGRIVFAWIISGNCVFQMARPDSIPVRYKVLVLALIAALALWGVLATLRGLTSVGADGVTVRGAFRVRRRAWHDIYDLRVEERPKQSRADVRWWTWLYDNDGRRVPLPNVDDWQLPDLRAEIDDLRTVAAAHRGMAWEPRPEVEARIRLRAGHRKAHERAVIGAVLAFFAGLMYLMWEVTTGGEPRPFLLLLCAPLAVYALLLPSLRRLASRRAPAHA
ncbi:PH domain-containing protein [Streptomyces sp. 3213]|uniref:PH domain-containing protein n=1 Tax=Streptomyces sp. 3213.3 TaxID=1855348 RepID=UPI00089CB672|nr:PH domain-containing protein [Streptomyces sp. 3213.3]SEE11747.1 PH domain-containing protein [Streptomyces sp. 3213] [Streptomyces sp. 3213.3]